MESRFDRQTAANGAGGVAVVTDTTANLPPDLVRESGIGLVSLYVNWPDGTSVREAEYSGSFDDFYERLRTAEQVPTTSQPSIGDFLEAWEPLIAQGREVVSIHISGAISGTVESARQAAEQLERERRGRVIVVDSQSGGGGLAMTVLPAVRAAQRGESADAVAERAREARADMKMWFAVDTLEYLRRGGRIGAASAWIGSALKIKPILTLEQEITPVERVRTSGRAFERLVAYAEERHDAGADGWVVQHIQAHEEAQRLVERVQEIMGRPPLFVSEVGPVLGVHVGPGMLGVGAIPSRLLERALEPAGAVGSAGERA